MASNLINIILCAIPETLYFILFMIFTNEEISQLLDIETNRITEKLDKIDFAIRIYCKI